MLVLSGIGNSKEVSQWFPQQARMQNLGPSRSASLREGHFSAEIRQVASVAQGLAGNSLGAGKEV